MGEDGSSTHIDFLASAQGRQDEVADKQAAGIINSRVRTPWRG